MYRQIDERSQVGRLFGVAALALSLVALFGTSTLLSFANGPAGPYVGAAIDSQDANILTPSERAILDGVASNLAWILLCGTLLGVTAIVLSVLAFVKTRETPAYVLASLAIAAAMLAALTCFGIAGWTLAAASTTNT